MRLRLHIRGLPWVAFLFAARLLVPASAAEPSSQPQPQAQQAQQTNAAAPTATLEVPANAVPAPDVPQIDNARNLPVFSPNEIGNLTLPMPATTPAAAAPQNRVLPANAGSVSNVNLQLDSTRPPANATPTSTPASTAYSPTWLIDGVRQLEMESRQRLRANASAGETSAAKNSAASESASASTSGASTSATTDNPLAAYLDKWITTPEGAAAVRAALMREAGDVAAGMTNVQADASANTDTLSRVDTTAPQPAPAPAPAGGNPYIDDLFQPQMDTSGLNVVLPPPPIPETQKTPSQSASAASPTQTPASAQDSTPAAPPIDASKLIIKPITPPPTAPVIDDKKYFPQLQRF